MDANKTGAVAPAIPQAIPLLETEQAWRRWRDRRHPGATDYHAMFSSLLGGIVTDPSLMVAPVDDHMVHRGDAVFETCKVVAGAIYNLPAHLRRLRYSASLIGLEAIPADADLIRALCRTAAAGGRDDCHLRILLSRGPGSLGANPGDCPVPGCYVIAYASPRSLLLARPEGATAAVSVVPAKPGAWARIKSCNYLPNVLMKREAVDRGVDFVLSFDAAGHLAEGATESAAVVDRSGRLLVPEPHGVLEGTTLHRVLELAEACRDRIAVSAIVQQPITRRAIATAAELLITGTTEDVLPVTCFEGQPVGGGRPGPVGTALRSLLQDDIRGNPAMRTPIRE